METQRPLNFSVNKLMRTSFNTVHVLIPLKQTAITDSLFNFTLSRGMLRER